MVCVNLPIMQLSHCSELTTTDSHQHTLIYMVPLFSFYYLSSFILSIKCDTMSLVRPMERKVWFLDVLYRMRFTKESGLIK